jgi:hypothetical protein
MVLSHQRSQAPSNHIFKLDTALLPSWTAILLKFYSSEVLELRRICRLLVVPIAHHLTIFLSF